MRKSALKRMQAARKERAEHLDRTGFASANELQEFNAKWASLGVTTDEVWPLPEKIQYQFLALEHGEWVEEDEDYFVRVIGHSPERAFRTPQHQSHIQERFGPVQQLNTSLHESIHFVLGQMAGYPHSILNGPTIVCKIQSANGRTGIDFLPVCGSVGYEGPHYGKFANEKRHECALMWLGPNPCMRYLMPESTNDNDFESDLGSVNNLGLTQDQDDSATATALSLISDSNFLAQVYRTAHQFRPLIRVGGEHSLP